MPASNNAHPPHLVLQCPAFRLSFLHVCIVATKTAEANNYFKLFLRGLVYKLSTLVDNYSCSVDATDPLVDNPVDKSFSSFAYAVFWLKT